MTFTFWQVELLGGGEIAGKAVYPVQQTVMEGELPITTYDCREPQIAICYGRLTSLGLSVRACMRACASVSE